MLPMLSCARVWRRWHSQEWSGSCWTLATLRDTTQLWSTSIGPQAVALPLLTYLFHRIVNEFAHATGRVAVTDLQHPSQTWVDFCDKYGPRYGGIRYEVTKALREIFANASEKKLSQLSQGLRVFIDCVGDDHTAAELLKAIGPRGFVAFVGLRSVAFDTPPRVSQYDVVNDALQLFSRDGQPQLSPFLDELVEINVMIVDRADMDDLTEDFDCQGFRDSHSSTAPISVVDARACPLGPNLLRIVNSYGSLPHIDFNRHDAVIQYLMSVSQTSTCFKPDSDYDNIGKPMLVKFNVLKGELGAHPGGLCGGPVALMIHCFVLILEEFKKLFRRSVYTGTFEQCQDAHINAFFAALDHYFDWSGTRSDNNPYVSYKGNPNSAPVAHISQLSYFHVAEADPSSPESDLSDLVFYERRVLFTVCGMTNTAARDNILRHFTNVRYGRYDPNLRDRYRRLVHHDSLTVDELQGLGSWRALLAASQQPLPPAFHRLQYRDTDGSSFLLMLLKRFYDPGMDRSKLKPMLRLLFRGLRKHPRGRHYMQIQLAPNAHGVTAPQMACRMIQRYSDVACWVLEKMADTAEQLQPGLGASVFTRPFNSSVTVAGITDTNRDDTPRSPYRLPDSRFDRCHFAEFLKELLQHRLKKPGGNRNSRLDDHQHVWGVIDVMDITRLCEYYGADDLRSAGNNQRSLRQYAAAFRNRAATSGFADKCRLNAAERAQFALDCQ